MKTSQDEHMPKTMTDVQRMGKAQQDALHGVLGVMSKVSYQQKKTAQGLRYSFAAIEDLVGQIRPAMVDAGIALRRTEVVSHESDAFENSNGKRVHCSTVHVRYSFGRIDFEGDEKLVSYEGIGYAQDTGDKAPAKAMTAALKVALRQGFLIEIGDLDPDKVHTEHVKSGTATTDDVLSVVLTAIKGSQAMERVDSLEKAALGRPALSDELSREAITVAAMARRSELEAAAEKTNTPEPKSLRSKP